MEKKALTKEDLKKEISSVWSKLEWLIECIEEDPHHNQDLVYELSEGIDRMTNARSII